MIEETGWVIEREDSEMSRPLYFCGGAWDHDNLKAIRFARETDARRLCHYMFPGEPHRIADHAWVDAAPFPPAARLSVRAAVGKWWVYDGDHMHCGPYSTPEQAQDWIKGISKC